MTRAVSKYLKLYKEFNKLSNNLEHIELEMDTLYTSLNSDQVSELKEQLMELYLKEK